MAKFILTEEEKNKILGLYEQPIKPPGSPKELPHPMDTPMWKKMTGDVEGDGVELLQYIPNQKLVIDVAFDNTIYTITAKKK